MNRKYHILFLIATLMVIALKVDGQYIDIVCAGSMRIYKTSGNSGSSFQWAVDGGGAITNTYGDSIEVTWGNKAGIYTIQVVQVSTNGCKGAPVKATVRLSSPAINLADSMKLCKGQTVILDAGPEFMFYEWTGGNKNQRLIVDRAGTYKVTAIDGDGCLVNDSVFVSLAPVPKVNLGPYTTLCEGETLELVAGPETDTLMYLWSDETKSNSKMARAGNGQMLSVKVTNLSGCSASDSLIIWPCNIMASLNEVQNTITPNGDGKNDTWIIPLLDKYPNTRVQIYDRWGRIVFQSEHGLPPNGWDGTSNGRILPMDSYHYIIDLKVGGMKATGLITIVR